MSTLNCIVCCQQIEREADSITEYAVLHGTKGREEISTRGPMHFVCIHNIRLYAKKKLECPCCSIDIRHAELYIWESVGCPANSRQLQTTLVTSEYWKALESVEQLLVTSQSAIPAPCLKKIFAHVVTGDLAVVKDVIDKGDLWGADGHIIRPMLLTAALWRESNIINFLIANKELKREIPPGWILGWSLTHRSDPSAQFLYDHLLGEFPSEQNKPTLEEIAGFINAAGSGEIEPIKEAMELPYFYETAFGDIGGQVLLTAIKGEQLHVVHALLENPDHNISHSFLVLACTLAAEQGNIPMLKELLAQRGPELKYGDRIPLLPCFANLGLSDFLFILTQNPPPGEVIPLDTFIRFLNTIYPDSPEILMVVICHMETCTGGIVAFNQWIEELSGKINHSDTTTLKFFDYFLESKVMMTSLAAGGLARAVAQGARILQEKTVPVLEKLVSYAPDGIRQEDKLEILHLAAKNQQVAVVQFILGIQPSLILTPTQKSSIHALPTSPEIALLLRRAYPLSFIARFREYCREGLQKYCRRGWEWISWISTLPAKVWQKFCSCLRSEIN